MRSKAPFGQRDICGTMVDEVRLGWWKSLEQYRFGGFPSPPYSDFLGGMVVLLRFISKLLEDYRKIELESGPQVVH